MVTTVSHSHSSTAVTDEESVEPLKGWHRVGQLVYGILKPEQRTAWELFMVILLLWICYGSPFVICFGIPASYFQGDYVGLIELFVDVMFIIDMYLNFRTSYRDSRGREITSRASIAAHYLKTWFILDFMAVIPFDLLADTGAGFLNMVKLVRAARVTKVVRLVKTYRMLRLSRLPRALERLERFLDQGVFQLAILVIAVSMLAHLSACIFYYMAELQGLGENTWVYAYGIEDARLWRRYLVSLYWAVTTVTTTGYGDVTPKSTPELFVAIFVMIVGVSVLGYVTSSITSLLGIKNVLQTRIQRKKQLVHDVLKSRSIPKSLSQRVHNFFKYMTTKEVRNDEPDILERLPQRMRRRVMTHLYGRVLGAIPAFRNLPTDAVAQLVSDLRPVFFVVGDVVVMQGDPVSCMYFIAEGELEVRSYELIDTEPTRWLTYDVSHEDDLSSFMFTVQGRLRQRFFFGHSSAITGGHWPATVVAIKCCELYSLKNRALIDMLLRYPEMANLMHLDPNIPLTEAFLKEQQLQQDNAPLWSHGPLEPMYDIHILSRDFPLLDAPAGGRMRYQGIETAAMSTSQKVSAKHTTSPSKSVTWRFMKHLGLGSVEEESTPEQNENLPCLQLDSVSLPYGWRYGRLGESSPGVNGDSTARAASNARRPDVEDGSHEGDETSLLPKQFQFSS